MSISGQCLPALPEFAARRTARTPGTLYANELVTDVGGTCWDRNEPLAIIDHHFSRDGQFPSASAAVLHKAKLIREKFAGRAQRSYLAGDA